MQWIIHSSESATEISAGLSLPRRRRSASHATLWRDPSGVVVEEKTCRTRERTLCPFTDAECSNRRLRIRKASISVVNLTKCQLNYCSTSYARPQRWQDADQRLER